MAAYVTVLSMPRSLRFVLQNETYVFATNRICEFVKELE